MSLLQPGARGAGRKLPAISAARGQLVALTLELPDHADKIAKKQKLPLQVLSDVGDQVAREYGIVFKMTPEVAEAMQKGAKLHERNGDASDKLPLSAAYVIAQDWTVTVPSSTPITGTAPSRSAWWMR